MKLLEILDYKIHSTKRWPWQDTRRLSKRGYEPIGEPGAFGTVHYNEKLPKRLNQVIKTAAAGRVGSKSNAGIEDITDINNDGYLYWIKATRHLNNRFIPNVHDLKIYKKTDPVVKPYEFITYKIKLEKLYDYNDIDNQVKSGIAEELFNIDKEDLFKPSIIDLLKMSIQDINLIKDKELKQAMQIIKYLAKNKGFKIDLHEGNVMWRMTGKMPQLVITDPLA